MADFFIMVSFFTIFFSTDYTTSTFAIFSPRFIGFLWKWVPINTMSFSGIYSHWTFSAKYISFLCTKFKMLWITARGGVTNYMIQYGHTHPHWYWCYKIRIQKSVDVFCVPSKIYDTIPSFCKNGPCPYPAISFFVNGNFGENSFFLRIC